jgi:DNA-binding response OmpR family regulator
MSRSPTILLLEDNPVLLTAMCEALEDQGYEVVGVGSSREALDLARAQAFDLVVTDIRMEGMDGLEALERMKEMQPKIHSMVVTGYSSEADSLRAIRLGAEDYLQKPFSLADFTQRVGRLLLHPSNPNPTNQAALAGWTLALDLLKQAGRQAEAADLLEAAEIAPELAGVHGLDEQGWKLAALTLAARRARLTSVSLPVHLEQVLSERWQTRPTGPSPEVQQGLLRLAHALEQSGRVEEATTVLNEILQQPAIGLDQPLARLSLARLLHLRGYPQRARQQLEAALNALKPLDLRQSWRGVLEGALLLTSWGEDGRPWLEEAAAGLTRLGDLSGAAQAHLALGQYTDSAIKVLLQPQHSGELAPAVSWLLPKLLQAADSPLLQRAARALVRQGPAEVALLIDQETLTPPERLRLVSLLQAEGEVMQPLLRRLQNDREAEVQNAACLALQRLGPSLPPVLRIYAMGAMEVFRGPEKVPETAWKTQKNRFLLAYLALNRGRAVAEERLADQFWSESNAQAKNLTGALSVLRHCLRPSHWQGDLDYVVRIPGQVALNPRLTRWHDVDEIELCLAETARLRAAGLWQPACQAALRAASYFRGQYLEDCYMDWVSPIRSRLENALEEALWDCLQNSSELNEHGEMLAKLLILDPGNQLAYAMQMRHLIAAGRPEQALSTFERCQHWLRREHSAEPGVELLELKQKARLLL